MLYDYMQRTQQLLADLKQENVNPAIIRNYINTARRQIAGDAECIRVNGSLSVTAGLNVYPFTAIDISTVTGAQGILNVRMITYTVNGSLLTGWPWEWFKQYYSNLNLLREVPTNWAQYAQGVNGSLYFYPAPDATYPMSIDTVCYPIDLTSESTAEAIPFPWTDTVPYFAAYVAYLTTQNMEAAKNMLGLYEEFKTRARKYSTPAVMPFQFEQAGMRGPVIPLDVGTKRAMK